MGCIPWADRYMIRGLTPQTRNDADHALGAVPQKGDSTPSSAALTASYITYEHRRGCPSVALADIGYESRAVVVRGGEPVEKDTGQQATGRSRRQRTFTHRACDRNEWGLTRKGLETPQEPGRRR